MAKVLLINGSPHAKGCTFTALSEVAETLNKNGVETEIFHIGKEPVSGCTACMRCKKTGLCIFEDGVNALLPRLSEFDGLVVGSPVYYASPSGQISSFMDRLFYAGSATMAGKPAAAVVSCRRGGATAAFDALNKYFLIANMLVVGSQYWNQVHGNTPEEVRRDAEGLQTMRTLGQNMAWLLKCLEAGKAAGIEKPVYEDRLRTNFIEL